MPATTSQPRLSGKTRRALPAHRNKKRKGLGRPLERGSAASPTNVATETEQSRVSFFVSSDLSLLFLRPAGMDLDSANAMQAPRAFRAIAPPKPLIATRAIPRGGWEGHRADSACGTSAAGAAAQSPAARWQEPLVYLHASRGPRSGTKRPPRCCSRPEGAQRYPGDSTSARCQALIRLRPARALVLWTCI